MSMKEKALQLKKDFDDVYKAGKQKQKEEHWNSLIDYSDFYYRFAGNFWNDKTFEPTKDIVPATGYGMFAYTSIKNLKECFDRNGAKLILAWCSVVGAMFRNGKFEILPEINVSSATTLQNLFYENPNLTTVEKLVLSSKMAQTFGDTVFYGCSKLRDIEVEGKIRKNGVILKYCKDLTKASIKSWMNALADDVSGYPITLPKIAVDREFETAPGANDGSKSAEWAEELAKKPNWTVILSDA